jgi:hypothetical protein
MFAGESIISIVFRFLNFGVLLGLAVYAFRRYANPFLRAQIGAKDAALYALKQQRDELKSQVRVLELQAHQHDAQRLSMRLKLERWQEVWQSQERLRYEEKQRLTTLLTKKAELQAQTRMLDQLQRNIFPAVLAQSRTALQNYFEHPEHEHKFTEQLLTFMQKGKM